MTAAAPERAKSKAAQFADEADALDWAVTRYRLENGGRRVTAIRGGEQYELDWRVNDRGNLVYDGGGYWSSPAAEPVEVTNVKAALRDMAKFRTATGALLPFDPEDSTDAEILEAVAGRRIEWETQFGTTESGIVPRGGLHLKITQGSGDNGGARILNFTDSDGFGFRAVYVSQIRKVS